MTHTTILYAQPAQRKARDRAAEKVHAEADVKIAQALKMIESAQRDFQLAQQMTEDYEAKTKDYEAMRLKLYLLERSVASARGAEPHERTTRKSNLDAASTEADRL